MARAAARKPEAAPGFHGFGRGALTFLEQLAENNNREWFQANREVYDREVLAPLSALVSALAFAFETHDIKLTGDSKRSLFRINRDVRFSNNKSPYKTNASFVMSRDGSKQSPGILYFQIGGGQGTFMAQGFYTPEPEDLAALRQAVADKPAAWAKTETALAKGSLQLSRSDTLVRMPKGFEAHADSAIADVLRLKSFVVTRTVPQAHLFSAALVDDVVAFARDGAALLAFGRGAILERGR